MDEFDAAFRFIQQAVLALAVVVLIIEGAWMYFNRDRWMYGVGVCLLMVHVIVFYTHVLLVREGIFPPWIPRDYGELFTYWSSILRAQELLMIASLGGLRLYNTLHRRKHG